MKKLVSYAFLMSMLFVVTTTFGQANYTFRVLANKGTNKVKKANTSETVTLKTGSKLYAGDEIIASDGAYIGLMHSSGKTTEIRGSGVKKVSDIEKSISTASSSVASRYAKFVMNKLNEDESKGYRSRLNATGAVSRSIKGQIEVIAPDQSDLMGDVAVIKWIRPEDMAEGESFVVKVENIFNEEIYSEETDKTSIELNFADEQLAYDMGLYLVKIYSKGNSDIVSSEIGIKKVKSNEKVEVQESLAGLKSEVSDDSPLNKIIYASFYEENGLLLDALTKYEEAVKMSPDISDFQELRDAFLFKYGLIE